MRDLLAAIGINSSASFDEIKTGLLSFLGLPPTASIKKIRDAYKRLPRGVWGESNFSDQKVSLQACYVKAYPHKPSPSDEELREYQKKMFNAIKDVFELLCSDNYKNPPVPADQIRQGQPSSKEELMEWLTEDGAQYKGYKTDENGSSYEPNQRFELHQNNETVLDNIFELIRAGKISYQDIQQLPYDKLVLIKNVILCDSQITKIILGESLTVDKFLSESEKDFSEGEMFYGFINYHQLFIEMDKSIARSTRDTERAVAPGLTEEEKLFIYIVSKKYGGVLPPQTQFQEADRVGLGTAFFVNMLEEFRDYRKKVSQQDSSMRIEQIARNLATKHMLVFANPSGVNEELIAQWVAPIEKSRDFFQAEVDQATEAQKTPDPVSQSRLTVLNQLLEDTKEIMRTEEKTWFSDTAKYSHSSDKISPETKQNFQELKNGVRQQIVKLYHSYMQDDAKLKLVSQHRKEVRAILKWLGCFFVAVCSFGGMYFFSNTIRNGLKYRTDTEGMLRDRCEALKKPPEESGSQQLVH